MVRSLRRVHDPDVAGAGGVLQPRQGARLGLALHQLVQDLPLGVHRRLEIGVLGGVLLLLEGLGLLLVQGGADGPLVGGRLVVLHLGGLEGAVVDLVGLLREDLPGVVPLRLQPDHVRPVGLELLRLLRVIPLQLRRLLPQLLDQVALGDLGDRLGRGAQQAPVAGLLLGGLHLGLEDVVVELLQLLVGDVLLVVEPDDLLLLAVIVELRLEIGDLLLQVLGLGADEFGGLGGGVVPHRLVEVDVGVGHGVGHAGGQLGIDADEADLHQVGVPAAASRARFTATRAS